MTTKTYKGKLTLLGSATVTNGQSTNYSVVEIGNETIRNLVASNFQSTFLSNALGNDSEVELTFNQATRMGLVIGYLKVFAFLVVISSISMIFYPPNGLWPLVGVWVLWGIVYFFFVTSPNAVNAQISKLVVDGKDRTS